ncbi:transcriptional regulator, TetR family [Paenibacillus sp. 1_12]|uniref:TetR/AcrR family transcriptional regulator n=1 Tax=Paenibacillus sp. 1_12 TaxID=1566278 RepID=UPI0008E71BDB|nr:TetR/AcrR family transcriptional regulator [Paenibacillus sp. 1_12]SFM22308.1 transcriptional regulator, TetR family [Paenibacillus sp. 1_12]
MAEPVNKLSLRSQEWIQIALFQLMQKKPYSQISIKEITDRAGLARQTFYRNFQDKDEILLKYLNGLMLGMWKEFQQNEMYNEDMFIMLFNNWKLHAPEALIHNIVLKDRKIRQIIYKSLSDYIDELFINKQEESTGDKPDHRRSYAQKSFSALVHTMLIEWTLQEFNMSPKEMGLLVNHLSASMREFL